MDKKYKEAFNKLHLSQDVDSKIFSKTINKKEYNPYLKKSLIAISIVLVLSITTLGIVFAKEIKEAIQKYFVTSVTPHTDGNKKIYDLKFFEVHTLKEVNYDALLPEIDWETRNVFENKPKIKLGELETKLETYFLHFKENKNQDVIILGLEKVNDKISKSKFWISNNKENISIQMQFATKYSKDYENGFSIQLLRNNHGKTIYLKEYSEKLKTDIYYAINPVNTKIEYNDDTISYNQAVFIYDDVAYLLSGNRISKNMLSKFIESVSLDEEDY